MSWTVTEEISARLGSKPTVEITYEEFEEFEALEAENEESYDMCTAYVAKIEALEETKKQLLNGVEILEGIIKCIDDEAIVTPSDQKLLAKRIKGAIKFIYNVQS